MTATTTIKILVSDYPSESDALAALAEAVKAINAGERSIYLPQGELDGAGVFATVTERNR